MLRCVAVCCGVLQRQKWVTLDPTADSEAWQVRMYSFVNRCTCIDYGSVCMFTCMNRRHPALILKADSCVFLHI